MNFFAPIYEICRCLTIFGHLKGETHSFGDIMRKKLRVQACIRHFRRKYKRLHGFFLHRYYEIRGFFTTLGRLNAKKYGCRDIHFRRKKIKIKICRRVSNLFGTNKSG